MPRPARACLCASGPAQRPALATAVRRASALPEAVHRAATNSGTWAYGSLGTRLCHARILRQAGICFYVRHRPSAARAWDSSCHVASLHMLQRGQCRCKTTIQRKGAVLEPCTPLSAGASHTVRAQGPGSTAAAGPGTLAQPCQILGAAAPPRQPGYPAGA